MTAHIPQVGADASRYDPGIVSGRMIVMLTCQYKEILGGAEKQCANLTANLRARGTNVVVVTSRVRGVPAPQREDGVRRFWTYAPPQLAGRHLPAALLWAAQVLLWIAFHRRQIAVLHCHQLRINAYVAAIAHKAFGIPTVMKPGCGGPRNDFAIIAQRKYGFGAAGARFVIRNTVRVVATAEQIRSDSLDWGVPEERIVQIVNGVDLTKARRIPVGVKDPRAQTLASRPRLAFVGRLSEEKNVLPIARAVAALDPGRPVDLEILGSGPLDGHLRALSPRSEGVTITLTGAVPDVFPYLRKAHFLLLLSSSEGLSNALLEAASAGVVPIVSDASGNRDVLPFRDYPLFVVAGGPEGINAALRTARDMSPKTWQMWSERVARATRSRFGAEAVCDRYLDLYAQITPADPQRAAT